MKKKLAALFLVVVIVVTGAIIWRQVECDRHSSSKTFDDSESVKLDRYTSHRARPGSEAHERFFRMLLGSFSIEDLTDEEVRPSWMDYPKIELLNQYLRDLKEKHEEQYEMVKLIYAAMEEEHLPQFVLVPNDIEAGEVQEHNRLLADLVRLGKRVREGTANDYEFERYYAVRMRLLEDKIAMIKSMQMDLDEERRASEGSDKAAWESEEFPRMIRMCEEELNRTRREYHAR